MLWFFLISFDEILVYLFFDWSDLILRADRMSGRALVDEGGMREERMKTPFSVETEDEGRDGKWKDRRSFVRGRMEEIGDAMNRMTGASWKDETRRYRVRRYEDRLFEARMSVFILEAMISLEKSRGGQDDEED